jgi:hypothetical protein
MHMQFSAMPVHCASLPRRNRPNLRLPDARCALMLDLRGRFARVMEVEADRSFTHKQ